MAIFTQYGEEVEIVDGHRDDHGMIWVVVRSVEDPGWERDRLAATLRADGGTEEIVAALQAVLDIA